MTVEEAATFYRSLICAGIGIILVIMMAKIFIDNLDDRYRND